MAEWRIFGVAFRERNEGEERYFEDIYRIDDDSVGMERMGMELYS